VDAFACASQQEETAFEEAGHAVIRCHFNHAVESVVIDGGTGYCELARKWPIKVSSDDWQNLARCQDIVAVVAGKCVVERLRGRKVSNESWCESTDYKRAYKLALEVNQRDLRGAQLLVAWLLRRCELMVGKEWGRIQKLADALLEKQKFTGNGRLSGAEIKELLG
jgi:hypothetical protein